MRVRLNLTDEELMNKAWIAVNLELRDLPYYDHKAKKILKGKSAGKMLDKLFG